MAMEATEDDQRLLISRPPFASAQEHPWLLIHHGRHRQLQTIYNVSKDCCYVRKISQLCNNYICFSHVSGWLVMEHLESDDCFLFNLVSMEKIQLPIRESNYGICVLTSPPTDQNNCHIIFINKSNTSIVFCRPGDSEFVEQSMEREESLLCATAFEGKFYGLRRNDMALVVLDFTTPTPQFRQIINGEAISNISPPDIIKNQTYIIESCGELLLVRKMWHGLSFNEVFGFLVFRADFSARTWIEVKSIGGKNTIYLDSHDGMCISSTKDGSIRGNSIYFTEDKDRCLYVFDLESQRIFFSLPSATVSRSNSMLHWVMMPT